MKAAGGVLDDYTDAGSDCSADNIDNKIPI